MILPLTLHSHPVRPDHWTFIWSFHCETAWMISFLRAFPFRLTKIITLFSCVGHEDKTNMQCRPVRKVWVAEVWTHPLAGQIFQNHALFSPGTDFTAPNFGLKIRIFLSFAPFIKSLRFAPPFFKSLRTGLHVPRNSLSWHCQLHRRL